MSNFLFLPNLFKSIINYYTRIGPLGWFFSSFFESFFPILPLSIITLFNIGAGRERYGSLLGVFLGYLFTWLGTSLGSILVFLIFRYIIKTKISKHLTFLDKHVQRNKDMVISNGIIPLFVISSIPLTPSSIINVGYGLSSIEIKKFVVTIFFAKAIMIFLMSLLSPFLSIAFSNIFYSIIIFILIGFIWYLLKKYEKKINNFFIKIINHLRK